MERSPLIDNLFTAMLEGRKATLVTKKGDELKATRIVRINERQNVLGYRKGAHTKNTYISRLKEVILEA